MAPKKKQKKAAAPEAEILDPEVVLKEVRRRFRRRAESIMRGESFKFDVPSRSATNQRYVRELDRIVLKHNTSERSFTNVGQVRKTAIMTRVFSLVHEVVTKGIHVTKRDLFYTDVKLFKKQEESDAVLDDAACTIGCPRSCLNVVAADKGLVVGRVQFDEDGDPIDCTRMGVTGKAIPAYIDKISNIRSDADSPCILITGKGQPDVATRMFLSRLKAELKIPVLAFVDSDPYGLKILSVYMSGSKAMSYDANSLTTPDIKWLGLRPSDLDAYNLPDQCRLPMTPKDIEMGKQLLKEDFVLKNKQWVKELERMLHTKQKAEIRAPPTTTGEQQYVKANTKYFAVALQGGGGPIAVVDHTATGAFPTGGPVLAGHKGAALDFDFHPFNEQLLASCSDDSTVKLWGIPPGGLTETLTEPLVDLRGHGRKVTLLVPPDGEQRTSCKDKVVRLFDPRGSAVATELRAAHEGSKSVKLAFLQDGLLATVGFTRQSQRQIKIWDARDPSKELALVSLDQAAGVLLPFFDPDTKMLYLCGKGDGNIRYYEINKAAKTPCFALSEHRSTAAGKGYCFLPKRCLDVMSCETARCLKLTSQNGNGVVEPLSFVVPRKSDAFQDDIFPDCYAGLPSCDADAWLAGANEPPKLRPLNPDAGFVAAPSAALVSPITPRLRRKLLEHVRDFAHAGDHVELGAGARPRSTRRALAPHRAGARARWGGAPPSFCTPLSAATKLVDKSHEVHGTAEYDRNFRAWVKKRREGDESRNDLL
ncbi:hypothetical protein JL720_3394 [Aureococcus anophagefferens]|nr:hypothetical protein JL720_3394 [Aureococcus anophagefferens]